MEHSGAIQAAIEGLSVQQMYLRDELFQKFRGRITFTGATAVVRGEKKLLDFGITDDEYESA